jgi:phosphatidylglycerophosphate synthase
MPNSVTSPADVIRSEVRSAIRQVAKLLNKLSGGKLKPKAVTLIGLIAHLPIAYLIARHHYDIAAILLIIFGLFDTLDGELARLQKSASLSGMLLDASTDRMKEVILYSGIVYSFSVIHPRYAIWAVIACGSSICVSYVKAKGEAAIASSKISGDKLNHLFQEGLLRFEVRMIILILGLFLDRLVIATVVIAVLASFTAIERLVKITSKLDVQN